MSEETPQASHRATQDMQLVQILQETHRTAAGRTDDPSWRDLHERSEAMLSAFGAPADAESPASPATEYHRIDRAAMQVDAQTAERVAASLMALADQPDERRVTLALEALASLKRDMG